MMRKMTPGRVQNATYSILQPPVGRQVPCVMKICIMNFAKMEMPAEGDGLYNACMEKGDIKRFVTEIFDGNRACRRTYLEIKMFRALIAPCSHEKSIAEFMKECGESEQDGRKEDEVVFG